MQITDEQRQKIKELAERYQLKLVLLFGSQATGRTHQKSDIDIGFLAEHSIDDSKVRFDMEEEMKHIFNRGDVELVDLSATNPILERAASQDGILLYESARSNLAKYKITALRQYIDTAPLRRLRHKRLEELVKSF